MWRYVIKRLILLIPVILGTILVVFFIMDQSNIDPALVILGQDATPELIAQYHADMGLDDPFLLRYARYVWDLLHGDMGISYIYHSSVFAQIAQRMPNTILLAGTSILLSVVIGIPIGVLAAKKQYSIFDNISMVVCMIGASAPAFWCGLLFVIFFSLHLKWFPASGMGTGPLGVLRSLVLPSFTLAVSTIATAARTTRASMLETIRQDYVDTARAKGTKESIITMRHMLRNALIPVVTSVGLQFGVLLGGSVLTETVFAWPGIGRYVIEAIRNQDIPSVLGCVVMLSITFTVVNLFVDILYAFIDPRIKAQYKRVRK